MSEVICPEVFICFSKVPVPVCQNFIVRSLLPPPVARSDLDHGQNATALIAASCPRINLSFTL